MRIALKYLLYFFIVLLPVTAQAQKKKSKAQLQREKTENLRRIKEASRILQQTKEKKVVSIGQLSAIEEQINVQQGVIKNISNEVSLLESDVQETEMIVNALQADLENLKAEYAAMIYAASKTANSYNKLMFLFASESFNQLVRRYRYLRQYSEARKNQVEQIEKVQATLYQQANLLTAKREEKKQLLSKQLQEKKSLLSLKDEKSQVIKKLSRQEQELKQEVNRRQQAIRKLDRLIADIVKEEIARAAREARRKGNASAGSNKVTLTPETRLLSSNFAGNKSRFLWPVTRGFISQRFGKHAHPVLRGVVVENRGVDIQTSKGEKARSIFDGKVLTVASVPGMNNIVMIQHGEYFTVYAKLKDVKVKVGQEVKTKDEIGTVYTNSDGTTELQFQVWKNSNNLNPEHWLLKK